jgi:hypothetical protein
MAGLDTTPGRAHTDPAITARAEAVAAAAAQPVAR